MRVIVVSCLALIGCLLLGAVTAQEPKSGTEEPKLGLELQNVRIRAALDEISKIAGEKHTSKGFVGDLSVSIFVHDPDPERIRAALKELLYLTWRSQTKDDKTTYTLWQDARGRLQQEGLVNRLAIEKAPYRYHQAILDAYDRASSLDAAGLEKLKKDDPFSYFVAEHPVGRAVHDLLIQVGPDAFALVGQGETRAILYDELTLEGQAAVRQFTLSMRDFMSSAGVPPGDDDESGEIDWSRVALGISGPHEVEKPDGSGTIQFGGELVVAGRGLETGGLSFPLLDPLGPEAQAFARVLLRLSSGEITADTAEAESEAEWTKEQQRTTATSGETERKIPEELQRVIEIKLSDLPAGDTTEADAQSKTPLFESLLGILAKTADIDIYADAFPTLFPIMDAEIAGFAGSRPIWQTLDLLAKRTQREWEYEDGVIMLRDRRWFEKRAWVIPEAWSARWRQALGERKVFEIEEIARAATELTNDQARHGIEADSDLGKAGMYQLVTRPWEYRLYGILSTDQIHRAERDGLPLADLRLVQAQMYADALSQKGRWDDEPADMWLKISRTEKTVELRITSPENGSKIEISLQVPSVPDESDE